MKNIKKEIKNIFESSQDRAIDIKLYEEALREFSSEDRNSGIYAKALSLSEGGEVKTKAKYLELKVDILKDEIRAENLRNRQIQEGKLKLRRDELRVVDLVKENKRKEEIKEKNQIKNKEAVNNSIYINMNRFNWILFLIFSGAVLSALFYFYVFMEESSELVFIPIILFVVGFYLLYLIRKIKKETDFRENRSRINALYIISIIFAFCAALLGLVSPVIGLVGLIMGIKFIYHLIKYNYSFIKIKKNE